MQQILYSHLKLPRREVTREAKEDYIDALLANGQTIPEPSSADQHSDKIALRMPKSIHRWVDLTAKKEEISSNQYINYVLSMAKGRHYKIQLLRRGTFIIYIGDIKTVLLRKI